MQTVAYDLVIARNAYIVIGYHLTDGRHGQKRWGNINYRLATSDVVNRLTYMHLIRLQGVV